MSNQTHPHLRLAIILIGVFVFMALCLGIYHCTHGGGWRTGTTELFFAVLMASLAFLVYRNRSTKESEAKFRLYRKILWGIMGVIILTLLIFSPYHFTHNGWRSGIIESTLAVILAVIAFLLR